ncbi:hypothetical protein PIB19_08055 [Sphingomonas sp. 7/4-4]|uniref:hypothetical protein n=1 Tax=Sphingomonas sp. 7/4-4 TaxID=3018446 RepID=UPI0022F3DD72|nr:hypothetical protein [Sphingomonas sp. 7/4-4]WBY09263.1 hypothetical protein PIB19_08055 [Sphingomonas sp. 7/4-4]
MERRNFLASALGAGAFAAVNAPSHAAVGRGAAAPDRGSDRRYMVDLLAKMASPILAPMSQGRLQATWKPELSPTWDGRNPKVGYLEAFGRLISGIAPGSRCPTTLLRKAGCA